MKKIFVLLLITFFAGVIFFLSCKKPEFSCEDCNDNKPPIAVAGPDQIITLPTDTISLDGSASNDPDGTISEWLWTKISGPVSFNIVNAATEKTVVRNLDTGVYRFELMVKDNGGLSAKDTVQITISDPSQPNQPPISNAGADQTITLPTNTVNLDGSGSTDPDNNITSYAWTKISGPSSFNITNGNAIQTQVNNLVQGTYQFELKVTDAGGLFSKDTMQVIVNAQVPPPPPTPTCAPLSRPIVSIQLVPVGNLSMARAGVAAVAAGNKIFYAGGYNASGPVSRVDIYDVVTNAWSTDELSVARSVISAVSLGNKVFFAGGFVNNGIYDQLSSRVDIYDLTTQAWSTAELSRPKKWMEAASIGSKVFFAGGFENTGISDQLSSRVDIYDVITQTWSTAELIEARMFLTAVSTDHEIYFAGGLDGNAPGPTSDKIDIYDNNTGTWSTSLLSEPKASFAGNYKDGKIYWAGGWTYDGSGEQNDAMTCKVEVRDINTQTSSFTNLSNPIANLKGFEINNKIIYWWNFDIYDITTNTWSIGVVNQSPLTWPGPRISHNNTIYLTGGYPNGSDYSDQVWKLEF